MKRFIALVLTITVLAGTAACGKTERNSRRRSSETESKPDYRIEELQEIEGTMLEITSTIRLPVEEGTDIDNTVIVEYDGHAYEVDSNYLNCTLSDEEYMTRASRIILSQTIMKKYATELHTDSRSMMKTAKHTLSTTAISMTTKNCSLSSISSAITTLTDLRPGCAECM